MSKVEVEYSGKRGVKKLCHLGILAKFNVLFNVTKKSFIWLSNILKGKKILSFLDYSVLQETKFLS